MRTVPSPRAPLLTAALAASEVGVTPATIRKWVQLRHLKPAGRRGRAFLYRIEDVFAAERAARGRVRTHRLSAVSDRGVVRGQSGNHT
ncbi:hypothetical protein AQ490_18510 [Wenjunlia vitaminophila]|uniref:Helix-turn-helix domain-containing protein n=1 Tax=Wenjunlia vitaminophila TaxID=76728 RepID=A0A0T6LUH3_WENVI|nr:hypothetical protein [Wenjunlia vitaminophila]KRV49704.1 hypothetical protein AQ490_18510 [Wenjunlia vitaminophila]